MALISNDGNGTPIGPRLLTLCSRGVLAEWDPSSRELLNMTELDIGEGKVKLSSIHAARIITYSAESK